MPQSVDATNESRVNNLPMQFWDTEVSDNVHRRYTIKTLLKYCKIVYEGHMYYEFVSGMLRNSDSLPSQGDSEGSNCDNTP